MAFTTDPTAPTSDEIFAGSKLPWARLGYADSSALAELTEESIGYVTWITGRYFSDYMPPGISDASATQVPFTPVALAEAPELIQQMRRAVRMRTEQLAKQDQPGYIDTATDDLISSFSAGPYSESRRDLQRRGEQKMLNPWPGLNDLLYQLMTEERREYWALVFGGQNIPAFAVEEVDWSLVGKNPVFLPGSAPTPPWWE